MRGVKRKKKKNYKSQYNLKKKNDEKQTVGKEVNVYGMTQCILI